MTSFDFKKFPQPDSNSEGDVEAALEALRNAHDESTGNEAYDSFLWSMGNNHSGTYYPIALGVLPELEKIRVNGDPWAQRAVMESLIDLGGSFFPEEGHDTYLGASLQETLGAFIQSIRRFVEPLTAGNDARAKSATDLLELIDDKAA